MCVLVFVCVRVCVLFSSYSATRSRRSPTTEPLEQDAANERYWREGAGLSVTPWVREKDELSIQVDLFPLHVSDVA